MLEVFTTRPDTLYGATYMVVAPEHPWLASLTTPEQEESVQAYVQAAASKSDLERTELQKSKTGVFTGAAGASGLPATHADGSLRGMQQDVLSCCQCSPFLVPCATASWPWAVHSAK